MALKVVAQRIGQFTTEENGQINVSIYMKVVASQSEDTVTWGPIDADDFTEDNLVAFVKEYANENLNAQIGALELGHTKLINAPGRLLPII